LRLAAMSGFAAVDPPAPDCGIERSSDITEPVRELRLPSPVLQRDSGPALVHWQGYGLYK